MIIYSLESWGICWRVGATAYARQCERQHRVAQRRQHATAVPLDYEFEFKILADVSGNWQEVYNRFRDELEPIYECKTRYETRYESKRAWLLRHPEKQNEYMTRYNNLNREKINERARTRRATAPIEEKARVAAYYAANRERIRENARAWYLTNRDRLVKNPSKSRNRGTVPVPLPERQLSTEVSFD